MTRPIRFRLGALMVATLVLALAGRSTVAQDATPTTEPIAVTVLGKGLPVNAPGQLLELDRITLAPGATIPTHTHPGAYVIYVESGEFGFTVLKGEAAITRTGSTTPEPFAAGPEVVGHAGDTIFENGGVVHAARNVGTTPLVLLTASLLASDQPGLQPTNEEGTPTA